MTPQQRRKILQSLIDSNIWLGNSAMIEGIFFAYIDLVKDNQQRILIGFGSPDYWRAVTNMFFPQSSYGITSSDDDDDDNSSTTSGCNYRRRSRNSDDSIS